MIPVAGALPFGGIIAGDRNHSPRPESFPEAGIIQAALWLVSKFVNYGTEKGHLFAHKVFSLASQAGLRRVHDLRKWNRLCFFPESLLPLGEIEFVEFVQVRQRELRVIHELKQ